MMEYIKGTVETLTPTSAVIDVNSIGYELLISLNTYAALDGQKATRLLVHEVIREDQWLLFGFSTEAERRLFRLLIGVSGVGANTARMILSAFQPSDLEWVIANGDDKRLKAVKGVGAKTAQRIIVDLRDKIKPTTDTLLIEQAATNDVAADAADALVVLGFPKPAVDKVLKKIFADDPAIKVDAAIRRALTML